ncbi:hypothetical protein LJC25_01760 [Bacteroidales bacterium OttesenSCG-928-K03]|nr:hypothetical protein [Odoribacter sp. OttesenSCG-928-L07]MDL2242434.1 hypothetical protein [Bacteroidales bacterium OttesenSCG-928-K03]
MKKLISISIFIFIATCLFAQVNPIEQEIINQKETKSVIIYKGKEYMKEKLIEGDLDKFKEIKDYLIYNIEDEYHSVFSSDEYILVLYYTREYETLGNIILMDIHNRNKSYFIYGNEILKYNLSSVLVKKAEVDADKIKSWIFESNIAHDLRDFLILYFNYIYSSKLGFSQDNLNELSEQFVKKYPKSKYISYILGNISNMRNKLYVKSNWGWTINVGLGCGILSGTLKDYYKHYGIIDVSFDIFYKKFALLSDMYFGLSKNKKPLEYSTGMLNKGSRYSTVSINTAFGYGIYNNHKIKITPYIGVGYISIGPESDKLPDEVRELELESITYNIGCFFDYKTSSRENSYSVFTHHSNLTLFYFRMGYSYNIPRFEKKHPEITGGVHLIKVMVGWEFRKWVKNKNLKAENPWLN